MKLLKKFRKKLIITAQSSQNIIRLNKTFKQERLHQFKKIKKLKYLSKLIGPRKEALKNTILLRIMNLNQNNFLN